ncbi:Transposase and inactivated derivatives, partial [Lachnospiraceae bacterium]
MAKYSYEFKKKLVTEYLDGHGSYGVLAQRHGLSDKKSLRQWVAVYNKFGDDGLKRSRNRTVYSFEEKLSIVESYLTSELSYQELALRNGISNPSI